MRHVRGGFRGGGFPLTSGDFCRLPWVSCVSGQGFSRVPGVLGRQRPRGGAGGRGAGVCGAAVRSLTPAGSGRPPARGGDAPGRRTGHRRAVTVACDRALRIRRRRAVAVACDRALRIRRRRAAAVACVRSRAGAGWCPGSGPCAGGGGALGPVHARAAVVPRVRSRADLADGGVALRPIPAAGLRLRSRRAVTAPCARSPAGGGGAAGGRGHPCPIPAGGGALRPVRSRQAVAELRIRSRQAVMVPCVRSPRRSRASVSDPGGRWCPASGPGGR